MVSVSRGWFSRKLHETCLCESARPVETGGKPDFLRIDRLRDTRRTASALAWRRAVKSGRSRLQGPRPKSRIQLLKFNKEIYVRMQLCVVAYKITAYRSLTEYIVIKHTDPRCTAPTNRVAISARVVPRARTASGNGVTPCARRLINRRRACS